MAQFKVMTGMHYVGGRGFSAGATFDSYEPLDRMFPGKIARVQDAVPDGEATTTAGMTDAEKIAAHEAAIARLKARSPRSSPPTRPQAAPVAPEAPVTEPTDPPETAGAPAGRDVTVHFPKAKEENFKVFRIGGAGKVLLFNVYDAENMGKPVNPRPIEKDEIDNCVRAALAGVR